MSRPLPGPWGPLVLLVGLPLLFLSACERAPEVELALQAPRALITDRPAFDGDVAFRLLTTQVAFGPRVPGWEGHQAQLAWMTGLLGDLADSLELQPFEFVTSTGDTLPITNLLARFNLAASRRILLLTHWDTRPWSDQADDPAERDFPVPGANDGASGTAILLQLAALMALDPPPMGVDLLFVDGEDYGPGTEDMFMGSRHFAQGLALENPWEYGVLLDLVGDADPLFPVEAYSAQNAREVVERVWQVAHDLGHGEFFPTRVGGGVTDDHIYLTAAGLPTADVIDFDYGPQNSLWHTPRDVPENTSAETLEMVGEVVTELVYRGG